MQNGKARSVTRSCEERARETVDQTDRRETGRERGRSNAAFTRPVYVGRNGGDAASGREGTREREREGACDSCGLWLRMQTKWPVEALLPLSYAIASASHFVRWTILAGADGTGRTRGRFGDAPFRSREGRRGRLRPSVLGSCYQRHRQIKKKSAWTPTLCAVGRPARERMAAPVVAKRNGVVYKVLTSIKSSPGCLGERAWSGTAGRCCANPLGHLAGFSVLRCTLLMYIQSNTTAWAGRKGPYRESCRELPVR